MQTKSIFSWLLRITIAILFLQTLYFKFTAHPDSVHIFTELGLEPYGRIGLGIVELITAFLILNQSTKVIGIFLSFGIILGAIASHFLVIGTNVRGDGGSLFLLALVIFFACIALFFLHKAEIQSFIGKTLGK